ncbi:hypothetical protein EC960107_3645, partial [Escherichia coli 96.0107]
ELKSNEVSILYS